MKSEDGMNHEKSGSRESYVDKVTFPSICFFSGQFVSLLLLGTKI